MNTAIPLSPFTPAPLRRRGAARRTLTVMAIGLSLPLLAACSSDTGSGDPSAPPATESSATAAPTDSFATPTIGANGDPFCDLAVQAQADAQELDNTTGEFNTLMTDVVSGTAPVADLNAWGSTLYDLGNSATKFYDEAVPYVAGTDVESDFVEMKGFVNAYSIPLAAMARDATDGQAFITEVGAFVQTPEVQAAITTGPAAAQRVAAYIADRCPAAG